MRRVGWWMVFAQLMWSAVWGDSLERAQLKPLAQVDYPARTQEGAMSGTFSVCALESDRGCGPALCVVFSFEKQYPLELDRLIKNGLAPAVERRGDEIVIVYSSGANSTRVMSYSIHTGVPVFQGDELIAWNADGSAHTSARFAAFAALDRRRHQNVIKQD